MEGQSVASSATYLVPIGISDYAPTNILLMHHDHHHYDLQQKYTQLLEIVIAFGCERFNADYFTI